MFHFAAGRSLVWAGGMLIAVGGRGEEQMGGTKLAAKMKRNDEKEER
jgi:hypothetical protein